MQDKWLMSTEYAAGFFDGEGCINCTKNKNGSPFIRILVVNTNIECLLAFQSVWGGDINKNYKPKENWKQAYTWRLSYSAAISFLNEIKPFLIIKKKQAELAIELSSMLPGKGNRWSDSEKEIANKIIDNIKMANKKGIQLNNV